VSLAVRRRTDAERRSLISRTPLAGIARAAGVHLSHCAPGVSWSTQRSPVVRITAARRCPLLGRTVRRRRITRTSIIVVPLASRRRTGAERRPSSLVHAHIAGVRHSHCAPVRQLVHAASSCCPHHSSAPPPVSVRTAPAGVPRCRAHLSLSSRPGPGPLHSRPHRRRARFLTAPSGWSPVLVRSQFSSSHSPRPAGQR